MMDTIDLRNLVRDCRSEPTRHKAGHAGRIRSSVCDRPLGRGDAAGRRHPTSDFIVPFARPNRNCQPVSVPSGRGARDRRDSERPAREEIGRLCAPTTPVDRTIPRPKRTVSNRSATPWLPRRARAANGRCGRKLFGSTLGSNPLVGRLHGLAECLQRLRPPVARFGLRCANRRLEASRLGLTPLAVCLRFWLRG